MRAREMVFLVVLISAAGPPVRSQEITLDGAARGYSSHYFMRTICPAHIRVNADLAAKTNGGFLILGNRLYGSEKMKAAVVVEVERRRKEIAATGEAAWCSYQRAAMIEYGLPELFR